MWHVPRCHFLQDATLLIDRTYKEIAKLQRLGEEGVYHVTKMKKNLKNKVLESFTYVNTRQNKGNILAKEQQ